MIPPVVNVAAMMSETDSVTPSPEAMRRANRKAAWIWGSIVVGFLSLQVAIGVVAIFLATGDPSVAVVPDYYEKALKWDDYVALQNESDRLGWQVGTEITPTGKGLESQYVMLYLRDAKGQPLSELSGQVRVYHHARAAETSDVSIRSMSAGVYSAEVQMPRDGLWEVEMDVRGPEGQRFVKTATFDVRRAGKSGAVDRAQS